MNISGVTTRIFDFSNKLVGHIKGGLGHVNVIASIIFAGMSGAAIADAGGLGTIEITAMRQAGYDDKVTIGITAASSTIGPIIPPSMVAVIYAVVASASVGRLFAAGIVPGFLMGGSLMVLIYYMAGRYTMPISPKATLKEILYSSKDAFFALLTPGIILGGIFFGIFTPTEAAAIASLYAIIFRGFHLPRNVLSRILRGDERLYGDDGAGYVHCGFCHFICLDFSQRAGSADGRFIYSEQNSELLPYSVCHQHYSADRRHVHGNRRLNQHSGAGVHPSDGTAWHRSCSFWRDDDS